MHLISIDASPRQVSKLRNGHSVRVKKGKGVFIVVHPGNYNLVSKAFSKGKGSQIQLSSDEIDANKSLSPELHQEMINNSDENVFDEGAIEGQGLYASGGSIKSFFKKVGKTMKPVLKATKPIAKELVKVGKPIAGELIRTGIPIAASMLGDIGGPAGGVAGAVLGQMLSNKLDASGYGINFSKITKGLTKTAKKIGKNPMVKELAGSMKPILQEMAHDEISKAHSSLASQYGGNKLADALLNKSAEIAHNKVSGTGLSKTFSKITKSVKKIGKNPMVKEIASIATPILKEMAHDEIAKAHSSLATEYGGKSKLTDALLNKSAEIAHNRVSGAGISDLRSQSLGNYEANEMGDSLSTVMIRARLSSNPIRSYWDEELAPRSRGSGLSPFHMRKHSMTHDMNLMRGRGSMIQQDHILPPAMVSQPNGANFHMQYFLPPQYKRDADIEGMGLYA